MNHQSGLIIASIPSNFTFKNIVGYENIKEKASRLANFDINILIRGETGVGKELFAFAIHNASCRQNNNFVYVNCATIPSGLLESELFGHSKGAFTSAVETRIGKVEFANKGTLFIDEIGNLSLEAQAKLLRVIEYKDIYRIGENVKRPLDIRFIFATNINLKKAIYEKAFRDDLYYRIFAHELWIPPLRERKSDIPKIVHYYWNRWREQTKSEIEDINKNEMAILLNYEYPGNVRELAGILESIYLNSIMNKENRIDYILEKYNSIKNKYNFIPLDTKIREYIKMVVLECKNISIAAKILKIDRKTINKYLKDSPRNIVNGSKD